MAGPISHTILAEKALNDFLPGKDNKHFIIGNLFPDIRYLRVIDRKNTHLNGLTLTDIQNEADSFNAGVLFHSLIDEVRESIVKSHDAYDNLPETYTSTVALKICEDMKLYNYSQKWSTYAEYLESIQPEEKEFGISLDKIKQWHTMHIDLFTHPSLTENTQFFFSLGFTQKQISEILELVHRIESSDIVDRYLDDFYINLRTILESQK